MSDRSNTRDGTARRDLRVATPRGEAFVFRFEGAEITAYPGETVAGALLASGVTIFRETFETGTPRGVFCGMGVCFDCLVAVEGEGGGTLRACMTPASPNLVVSRPAGART